MLHLFERIFAANRFAFLAAVIASYISAFLVALILAPGNLFISAWLFYPRDLIMLWITVAFIPFVIIIAVGKPTRTSSDGSDSSSEGAYGWRSRRKSQPRIVAAICALAIDEIHELEKKDSFRVAVAADVRADLNLIRSERAFEPAALFDANSSPLTTWDRMAPRVGDLPETAVEPVAIFYSRLRSIIGIRPSDSVKMLEWRQGMSATMTACGLWALERLEGDNHSGWYREWVEQLQDVQSTLREDESTCVALLNPSRNP